VALVSSAISNGFFILSSFFAFLLRFEGCFTPGDTIVSTRDGFS
jgi:hypothetical protein